MTKTNQSGIKIIPEIHLNEIDMGLCDFIKHTYVTNHDHNVHTTLQKRTE